MHAAKLEKSDRLQRTLKVLKTGGWHSTLDITINAQTTCASTNVAELRENGITILTKREKRGRSTIWLYKWVPEVQLELPI